MNDSRPLVLSRQTVAIVSLFAAFPLVLFVLLFGPRILWTDAVFAVVVAFYFGGGGILGVLTMIGLMIVETTFRWIKFVGLKRLPWFSLVLIPGFVLCWLAALGQAQFDNLNVLIAAGFVMFIFQVIGQLSLVQPAEDDSHLNVTDSGRR